MNLLKFYLPIAHNIWNSYSTYKGWAEICQSLFYQLQFSLRLAKFFPTKVSHYAVQDIHASSYTYNSCMDSVNNDTLEGEKIVNLNK